MKLSLLVLQVLKAATAQLRVPFMFDILSLPDDVNCAICYRVMADPVMLKSGHSYCRSCLGTWFESGRFVCPRSNTSVSGENWPNHTLRTVIEELRAGDPFVIHREINNDASSDHQACNNRAL